MSHLFSKLSGKLVTFLHLKTKFHRFYILVLFTNLSAVAVMLSYYSKHLRISAFTRKRVKGDDDSATKEHLLFCNHTPGFEDFSILAANNKDFKVTLLESLLINRDHLR